MSAWRSKPSRIDAIFAVQREINGLAPAERQAARDTRSRPLVEALHAWLPQNRGRLLAKAPVAKAIDYTLKRWPAFFLDEGRICLSNNAAEPTIRPIAVGRRHRTFA